MISENRPRHSYGKVGLVYILISGSSHFDVVPALCFHYFQLGMQRPLQNLHMTDNADGAAAHSLPVYPVSCLNSVF